MNEDLRRVVLKGQGRNLLEGLGNVAQDLWGTSPKTENTTKNNLKPEEKHAEYALPSREKLWQAADEPIDWTDALTYTSSPDGLTSQEQWNFYRAHARGVLDGNTKDYAEVLEKVKPLDDIADYAKSLEITAISADKLRADFVPAQSSGEYFHSIEFISGAALRIGRDLLAVLPVSTVEVNCFDSGRPLVKAEFSRDDMQGVRFSYIDPVEFIEKCGGTISAAV